MSELASLACCYGGVDVLCHARGKRHTFCFTEMLADGIVVEEEQQPCGALVARDVPSHVSMVVADQLLVSHVIASNKAIQI
jgi:hypothetical protein